METSEKLGLIALMVALSAYIATIRWNAIERLRNPRARDKEKLEKLIRHVTLADIPLVVGALVLTLELAFAYVRESRPCNPLVSSSCEWGLPITLVCFISALLVLGALHFGEWRKAFPSRNERPNGGCKAEAEPKKAAPRRKRAQPPPDVEAGAQSAAEAAQAAGRSRRSPQ